MKQMCLRHVEGLSTLLGDANDPEQNSLNKGLANLKPRDVS